MTLPNSRVTLQEQPHVPGNRLDVRAGLARTYHEESGRLLRHAVQLGLPRALAEDVIQEVWLAFLGEGERFRAAREEEARAWMRRVLRCKTVDALRRLGRQGIVSLDAVGEEALEKIPCWAEPAAEERRQYLSEVLSAFAAEDPDTARLLHAYYVEGQPLARLAAERQTTVHALHCRLSRLRKELRRRAEKQGEGDAAIVTSRSRRKGRSKKMGKSNKA